MADIMWVFGVTAACAVIGWWWFRQDVRLDRLNEQMRQCQVEEDVKRDVEYERIGRRAQEARDDG